MKLFELDAPKSKRVASVMSSHFGKTVDFDKVTVQEAKTMLPRVNKMLKEHRKTPKFHSSEKNPAYLELVMIEQALRDKVNEEDLEEIAPLAGVAARAAGAAARTAAVNKLTSSKHRKKQHKEIEEQDTIPIDLAAPETQSVLDKLERGQTLNTDEQKIANAVAAKSADSQISEAGAKESFSVYKSLPPSAGRSLSNKVMVKAFKTRDDMGKFLSKGSNALHWKETGVEGLKSGQYRLNMVRGEDGKPAREFVKVTESLQSGRPTRRLDESDIEQAQVVLAAKDLVDRVQKMIEDVSEVQYKDLPALVDQARTDLGTSEADSFQQNIGPALDELIQSLQSTKEKMNNGLSALTGEETLSVPGEEDEMDSDLDTDLGDDDIDLDLDDEDTPDLDLGDTEETDIDADLGRERR